MFQRHPCGVHAHMPGCARSGSSSQDIWCLPPAPPHPGRGPGGRGCRGRGQCGWGHSPYAKAARCPQASPSGQMHSGHPSLLSWKLTCPEGQRAPGPHRQALVRPPGAQGQHLPGPSPLSVWESLGAFSVLASTGQLAGLTSAALLLVRLVRAVSGRRAEQRPRASVCRHARRSETDPGARAGGEGTCEERAETQVAAGGDSRPRPSSVQAAQLGLRRARAGPSPRVGPFHRWLSLGGAPADLTAVLGCSLWPEAGAEGVPGSGQECPGSP